MENNVAKIIQGAKTYYRVCRDPNGRYRSWGHCYKAFYEARNSDKVDIDLLSLNLAFYLASWGMYRGSSFLLQKDYKIHAPVVEEVLKTKYDVLMGVTPEKLGEGENLQLMMELGENIRQYYEQVRKSVVGYEEVICPVSDVLITKVLMGVLGCVPAYDRFFREGLKITGVSCQKYGAKSLKGLIKFYAENYEVLEKARSEMNEGGIEYPPMKLIDMGFWQIGFDKG